MSYIDDIKRNLRYPYTVTIEILVDDNLIGKVEISGEGYSKHLAIKNAMKKVEANLKITAVGAQRNK